jgi:hypothetical protein
MNEIIIEIVRKYNTDSVHGDIIYNGLLLGKTLELPYRDNKTNISSIPEGEYYISIKNSTRINVKNVPNRSNIQIHTGNVLSQTKGCLLIGSDIINNNIYNSMVTMNLLQQIINMNDNKKFKIKIR